MNKEQTISALRSYLRGLSRRRSTGRVTADDAHTYFSRKGFVGNDREKLSIIRSVLQEPTFFPMGEVMSRRPEAKSRRITSWTY